MSTVNPFSEAHILVVDDDANNLALLKAVLEMGGYRHIELLSDSRRFEEVKQSFNPDAVLLDLMMPFRSGQEILLGLKQHQQTESFLPVFVVTADTAWGSRLEALENGAYDFLLKPVVPQEVLLRLRNALHTRFLNKTLELKVQERTAHLEQANLELVVRLAQIGEYRSEHSRGHAQRVGYLAGRIAAEMDWPVALCEQLTRASRLHNIGQVGVPDALLNKPSKLEPHEFLVVQRHTQLGYQVLAGSPNPILQMGADIALSHHERWDGQGYPQGLAGQQIPISARIVAVAATFDAMIHPRPYRPAHTLSDALLEIRSLSGSAFDPYVVLAFLRVIERGDFLSDA